MSYINLPYHFNVIFPAIFRLCFHQTEHHRKAILAWTTLLFILLVIEYQMLISIMCITLSDCVSPHLTCTDLAKHAGFRELCWFISSLRKLLIFNDCTSCSLQMQNRVNKELKLRGMSR